MTATENKLLFLEEALELLPLIQAGLWELSHNYNQQAIGSITANILSIVNILNQSVTQVGENRARHAETSSYLVNLEEIQTLISKLKNLLHSCEEQTLTFEPILLKQLWQIYIDLKYSLLTHLSQVPMGRFGILAKGEFLFSLPLNPITDKLAAVQKLDTDLHEAMLNQDIVQSLANLELILDNPNSHEQSTKLKHQADVLHGLGELLEVKDLIAIAQSVNICLDHNWAATQLIGQRALACWQAVQTARFSDLTNYQGEDWRDYLFLTEEEREPLSTHITASERILKTGQLFMWLAGFNIFFLPANRITAMVIPQAKQVKYLDERQFFIWQEQNIPLYQLSALLNYNYLFPDASSIRPSPLILVIQHNSHLLALEIEVEQPVVESELTLKSLHSILTPPSYVCGCTVLDNDRMKVVIDLAVVLNQVAIVSS